MLDGCLQRVTAAGRRASAGLIAALLIVPTAAVIFEEHTGLIYCLEILAGLVLLSVWMGKAGFRELVEDLTQLSEPSTTGRNLTEQGESHAGV